VENEGVRLTQAYAVTVDIVKTKEEEGAKKAAGDAMTELVKELAQRSGSFLGIGMDAIQHQERLEGMAAYKASVQQNVQAIENAVDSYRVKMRQSQARAQAIQDLITTIDNACTPSPTFNPNLN
jgi:glutaredoxin 2